MECVLPLLEPFVDATDILSNDSVCAYQTPSVVSTQDAAGPSGVSTQRSAPTTDVKSGPCLPSLNAVSCDDLFNWNS